MRAFLIVLLLALSACASGAPPRRSGAPVPYAPIPASEARAAGVDFRAVGYEPGWLLDIGTNLDLIYDYGARRVVLPASQPDTAAEGATRYSARGDGHSIAVTIQRYPCTDNITGEAKAARVTVVIDGRTLTGCGASL